MKTDAEVIADQMVAHATKLLQAAANIRGKNITIKIKPERSNPR